MTKEILQIKAIEEIIKKLQDMEEGKLEIEESISVLAMSFKNILINILKKKQQKKLKEKNIYI